MKLTALPLLLFVLLAAEDKPTPKLPLGKETTYVSGPLDKEGYIDYEAALNDRLGKGITPEKNANVLLWKALGPTPEGKTMPADYFKWLGIDEPPREGEYFIELRKYASDHLKLSSDESTELHYQLSAFAKRPWSEKDYPHIFSWLKINKKPLVHVLEATRRPDYFHPLVPPQKRELLLMAQNSNVHLYREFANALTARAMWKVEEGKFDAAWEDLLACHRLGRLLGRNAWIVDTFAGFHADQSATAATLVYIERSKLTSRQSMECLKEVQALSPMPPLADKLDVAERIIFLDAFQSIRRGGDGALEMIPGGSGKKPSQVELEALGKIDWEPGLREANRWYDRIVTAMRHKERVERDTELKKLEADLKALRKEISKPEKPFLISLLIGKGDKMIGKLIGDNLIVLMLPALEKLVQTQDRLEQEHRNLHIAFALAAYHADNGRYPAKLDDLAPKYLTSVPNDLFSGKPLIYRLEGKGYFFYSVGVNGKDEGGRWRDDDPPGDDLGVRMPLPELKTEK